MNKMGFGILGFGILGFGILGFGVWPLLEKGANLTLALKGLSVNFRSRPNITPDV